MSDGEGSDQEVKKKEPVIKDPKNFFISHVNSYTGRILYEELSTEPDPMIDISKYSFNGTLETTPNVMNSPAEGAGAPDEVGIVKMQRTRAFRDAILASDVIIYDLMTNDFKEVDYVIKTLKTTKLESKKTLIILSSVLTWVNTLPKLAKEGEGEGEEGGEGGEGGEEGGEEGEESGADSSDVPGDEGDGGEEDAKPKPPKVLYFKESDYHLRVPHERYLPLKNLESLAMAAPKTQPMLKVHILCGGIRYGHGE